MKRLGVSIYRKFRFSFDNVLSALQTLPSGIVHVGGNIGSEAEAYARAGIPRVVWIEGFPDFFRELSRNIAPYPGQAAFCLFASDRDEELTFHLASNGGSSTLLEPTAQYRVDFPQIEFAAPQRFRAQRLDAFFADRRDQLAGCDLLILDVEGAELKALQGMGRLLDRFRYVLTEVSLERNFVCGPRLSDIDKLLATHGFELRKIWIGRTSGDALYVRAGNLVSSLPFRRLVALVRESAPGLLYYRVRRRVIDAAKALLLGS